MPVLYLRTNVPVDSLLTSDIIGEVSATIARALCKPEKSVMVLLEDRVAIRYTVVEEPTAWCELVSVGGLGPEQNESLHLAITSILEEKLSIPKVRIHLCFQDVKQDPSSEHICCMHATCHASMG